MSPSKDGIHHHNVYREEIIVDGIYVGVIERLVPCHSPLLNKIGESNIPFWKDYLPHYPVSNDYQVIMVPDNEIRDEVVHYEIWHLTSHRTLFCLAETNLPDNKGLAYRMYSPGTILLTMHSDGKCLNSISMITGVEQYNITGNEEHDREFRELSPIPFREQVTIISVDNLRCIDFPTRGYPELKGRYGIDYVW